MSHLFRIPVAVVSLLVLGLSGIAAPADYDLLQAQKVQSVRAVLPALGSDVEAQVIEEAATRAVALSTLQIDSAASRPTVTFGFSGAPLYAARIEQAPLRLVIDFADTILLTNLQTMTIDGGNAIVNVDTAMIGVHPQFVCRTVIELSDACAIGIEKSLTTVSGVQAASVDFAAGQATVYVDPGEVSGEDLLKAVQSAGEYTAQIKKSG